MKTPTQLRPLPTRWFSVVVLSGFLAACGGSQRGSAEDKSSANAAGPSVSDVASSQQGTSTSAALVRGAALSSVELATAEEKAVAADAATSSASATSAIPLEELPAGQIAAKSAYTSGAIARKAAAVRIPVYRFFNGSTGAHFFTTNTTERDNVVNTLSPPFNLEGTAFSVASDFSPGLSPVHRFYNTQTGVHFYTISESERATVAATLPHFNYEGVAYHASQVAGAGLIPFYRFFVPSKGFHFYTANEAEKDSIIANLSAVYHFEGVGYHVLDSDWRAEKLPHSGVTSSSCFRAGNNTLVACSDSTATSLNPQQDGHRAAINALSYSAVGSHPLTSCVKDNITGLIWEGKEASGARSGLNTYTHLGDGQLTDASGYVSFVNAIALCGFSDWRLPARQELLDIVDHGRTDSPRVNIAFFPNTSGGFYWTSQALASDATQAWRSGYSVGFSSPGVRTGVHAVRLVRGGAVAAGARFTFSSVSYTGDAAGNLVNDAWTGLQWRRCEEGRSWDGSTCTGTPGVFTNEQALLHARSFDGWRVPHVKELVSLTDLGVSGSALIDATAFPGAHAVAFWTSTPDLSDGWGDAWSASFAIGSVASGSRFAPRSVRLVRANP